MSYDQPNISKKTATTSVILLILSPAKIKSVIEECQTSTLRTMLNYPTAEAVSIQKMYR